MSTQKMLESNKITSSLVIPHIIDLRNDLNNLILNLKKNNLTEFNNINPTNNLTEFNNIPTNNIIEINNINQTNNMPIDVSKKNTVTVTLIYQFIIIIL